MSPLDGLRGIVEAAEAELEQLRAAEVAAQEALITCEQAVRDQAEPEAPRGVFTDRTVPFDDLLPGRRHEADLARLRREGAEQRLEHAQARLAEVEGSDIAERYIATRLATDRARVFEDLRPTVAALAAVRRYELASHPSGHGTIVQVARERPDPTAEDHAAALEAFGRDELERGRCLRAIRERLEQHRSACEELPTLAEELALTSPRGEPVEQREIDALVALASAPLAADDQDKSDLINWLYTWAHTFAVESWMKSGTSIRSAVGDHRQDPIEYARLAVELGDARDAFHRLVPPRPPTPDTSPSLISHTHDQSRPAWAPHN